MYLIKSREAAKIAELSEKCLQNKLYVKGRLGKTLLSEPSCISILTVLFDLSAIGWGMIFYHPYIMYDEYNHIAVYIDKDYRGRDFGELLINKTIERIPHEVQIDPLSSDYFEQFPNLREVLVGNTPKLSFEKRVELFNKLPLTEETYFEDKI